MASGANKPDNANLVDPTRFRGHRGGVIAMHRALTHFRLGPMNLATAVSLFAVFASIWVAFLPLLCRLWKLIFILGLKYLPLNARLETVQHHFGFLRLSVPCLRMEPLLPGLRIWSFSCAVTLLLLLATFFLPKSLVPVVYLLRAILLVETTALIYFALWPSLFPHTPDSYLDGLVASSIAVISIVPLLYALVYYIFDFGLPKKAFLTFVTMAHLTVFVPFQVLLQALVLQKTILFMPLLYIIFGMPMDILLIVAFYAWGMTWAFRSTRPPFLDAFKTGWQRAFTTH
jgi:hypothetical protein